MGEPVVLSAFLPSDCVTRDAEGQIRLKVPDALAKMMVIPPNVTLRITIEIDRGRPQTSTPQHLDEVFP